VRSGLRSRFSLHILTLAYQNANCYTSDPTTSVAMVAQNKTLDGLLFDFVVGIHKTLRDAGKTPVVWEEVRAVFFPLFPSVDTDLTLQMVLEHALQLGNDTIVTVWISSANVKAVADKGYRIVHGASDYFYLDCGGGGWVGDGLGSGAENSWCE
jgi:hexosaminidase